jgi:hypothetical protein
MITEKEIREFLNQIIPTEPSLVMMTGKQGVRDFARVCFGDDYTFTQLLSLFRSGVVSGYKFYTIQA